jgi:pyruvate carboxylase
MSSQFTLGDTLLAHRLIGSIRAKYPDIPIHVHSHDTAGISTASMIAAAAAGADVVDLAIDSKYFLLYC